MYFPVCLLPEPPSAPQDLSLINTGSGKVTLSWKPPSNNGGSPVTGYILQAAPAGTDNFEDIAKVNAKTSQYEALGLQEGKEYMFRIKAENSAGTSEDSAQLDKPVKASPKIGKSPVLR